MKIAAVILMAFLLSGCAGLGLIAPIAQGLGNMMGGGNQQQVYYQRPASYSCYSGGPWTNCYAN